MWFRRLNLQRHETRSRGEADLGTTGGMVPSAPYPIDDELAEALPNTEPGVSASPMELRVRYRQTQQFKPTADQLARNLVIGVGAPAEICSAYNRLRTQVITRLQENRWSTVAITSPSKFAGTTLTAINLAISIAREYSYTVLLVELDLVNPSFGEIFGFKQRQGIVDHLLHDVPIPEILLNPGIDRLVVLPAGSPVINSSELLSSPKMTRLVDELKRRYEQRIVLFDLPPALNTDDAMAFSQFVDCALLVVGEGESRVDDVRRSLDYLRLTNILGIVLNRSVDTERDGKTILR